MIKYFCKNCGIEVDNSECPICGGRTQTESKIYWCDTCQIPTYDEECPLCHSKGHYITSDIRPVFPEERLLVEILIDKPLAFINASVWNGAGNRYYVNGKKIALSISKVKDNDPEEIRKQLEYYKDQNDYSYFNMMIDRWIRANANHYNYISTEAKEFIQEHAKKYLSEDLTAAFVSFSGGKDSTVVSDLVRKALGTPSIIHIFGNTTLEFPHTYEYIKRFRQENRKTPLLRAENKEQDFFNLCNTFGPPSRALRWCCTIFKTGFIGDKISKTFGDEKTILTVERFFKLIMRL